MATACFDLLLFLCKVNECVSVGDVCAKAKVNVILKEGHGIRSETSVSCIIVHYLKIS